MYGNPAFDCDGAQIRVCSRQLATVVTVTGDLDDANLEKVSAYAKRFVLREKPMVLDLSGVNSATPHIISLLSELDDACIVAGVESARHVRRTCRGHTGQGSCSARHAADRRATRGRSHHASRRAAAG